MILTAGCKEDITENVIQKAARIAFIALRDRLDQLLFLFNRIGDRGILQLILLKILANGLILLGLIPLLDHSHTAVPNIEG